MNEFIGWNELKKIENEYFTAIGKLLNDRDKIHILLNAYRQPEKIISILRLLETLTYPVDLEILKSLFPNLLYTTLLDTETNGVISRKVLSHIERNWLREHIPKEIRKIKYLNEDIEWFYRRTAELYKFLGFKELLIEHLKECEQHGLSDVNEISKDFESEIQL